VLAAAGPREENITPRRLGSRGDSEVGDHRLRHAESTKAGSPALGAGAATVVGAEEMEAEQVISLLSKLSPAEFEGALAEARARNWNDLNAELGAVTARFKLLLRQLRKGH